MAGAGKASLEEVYLPNHDCQALEVITTLYVVSELGERQWLRGKWECNGCTKRGRRKERPQPLKAAEMKETS